MHFVPRIHLHLFFAAAMLSSTAVAMPASAQDLGGAPREQPRRDRDHVIVGVGGAIAPAYQGADDYRALPLPMVDIAKGPFFLNFRNGLGINVIDTDGVTLGGSLAPMPGYRRRDAPDGIGRLSFGAGARLFARVATGGVVATIGGTKGFIGGTKGFIADASLSYPIIVSRRLVMIPTIGTTWADRRHNDRYFGVDEGQSAASTLPRFSPGAGFKDASALLTASYRLSGRINLSGTAGVTTLLGDVSDSPIVFHKTQPTGFLTLSFRLGS